MRQRVRAAAGGPRRAAAALPLLLGLAAGAQAQTASLVLNPTEIQAASLDGATVTLVPKNSTFLGGGGGTNGHRSAEITLAYSGPGITVDDPVTVTVRGGSDSGLLRWGTQDDANFPPNLSADFTVRVASGVAVSRSSLSVPENQSATYTVALQSRPSGNVVISATSGAAATAAVSPSALTFTPSNWSTPRTVTVTGRSAGATAVGHAVRSSADTANYPTTTAIPGVDVKVTAPPTAELVPSVVGLTTLPEGAGVIFNIVLSRSLAADETVTLPLAAGGTAGGSDYRLVCVESIPAGAATCNGIGGSGPSVTFHGEHMTSHRTTGPLRLEAVEDGRAEANETVTLSLGGGRARGLTLRDAPSSVFLSFVLPAFSAGEDADLLQPTLRASAAPGRDIEVPLVFTDITAAAGEDYVGKATVTFEANGATVNSFNLSILDDMACEGDETFAMEIDGSRLPAGVRVGSPRGTVFTIRDNDICRVGFDSAAHSVAEGDSVGVTVTIDPPQASPVEVGLVYSDASRGGGGTASRWHTSYSSTAGVAFGKDYEPSPESVTIPANAASGAFTVRTLGEPAALKGRIPAESDETFHIAIDADTLPPGFAAGDPSGTTVTIKESNVPSVTVAADVSRVDEGGAAAFTVTVDPPPAEPLEVNVEVVEDNRDSRSVAAGGLGRRKLTVGSDGAARFSIATVDDSEREVHATLTARLRAGRGYTVGGAPEAAVRVSDNDQTGGFVPLTLNFRNPTLPEGAGVLFNHVLNSPGGSRTPQIGQKLTLPLEVGGTATPGTDYRLVCVEVLPPGIATCDRDDNGRIVSFTFDGALFDRTQYRTTGPLRLEAIADDDADEPDETVVLTFGGGSPLTVTLTEAPASVRISLTRNSYTMAEGDNVDAIFDVAPPTGGPIPLPLVFTDLTATAGADYTVPENPVIPADGAVRSTLKVFSVADAVAEGVEAFRMEIDAAGLPAGVTLGDIPSALFFIAEDDGPVLLLTHRALKVGEGGSVEYAVRPATRPTENFSVRIASDNPDVTVSPARLDFSRNSSGANAWTGVRTVTVTAAQDSGDGNADDAAVLTHTASGGDYEGLTAALDIAVDDDDAAPDPPGVTVSPTALSLTEGGSAGSYTVVLDAAPGANVTVTATSGDGGKVRVGRSGDTPAASATLTFTPTDWNRAQSILVTPRDDADTNDETVTITHGVSGTGGYGGVTAAPVAVAVDDDDTIVAPPPPPPGCVSPQVEADVRAYAAETQHGQAHVDRWMKVLAAFGDSNGHTAMTAAEARQMRDQFSAGRWNPVVQAIECIDGVSGDPLVSVAGGAAVSEGGNAVFTVTADAAPSSSLTVTLHIADAPGSDFLAQGDEGAKNVTIPANQTSAQLTLATRDDSVYEPDGAVAAALAAGVGYRVGSPSSATVAVTDDDPVPAGGPTLAVSDAEANEAGQGISFYVTLSRPLEEGETVVSFAYRLRESNPVSAREGEDYSPGEGTGNFLRGGTSYRLRFYLNCDSVAEGDETFELVLTGAQGATLADGVGVGTIRDRGTRPCRFDPNAAGAEVPPAGLSGEIDSPEDPAAERDRRNPRNGAAGFEPDAAPDYAAGACVSPRLRSGAAARARETWRGPAHVERWLRVSQTFSGGANDALIVTPAEARFHAAAGRPGWLPVADALDCMEQRSLRRAAPR